VFVTSLTKLGGGGRGACPDRVGVKSPDTYGVGSILLAAGDAKLGLPQR
jgi:hypothetical protein